MLDVDYNKIFIFISKFTTNRTILEIKVGIDLKMNEMDIQKIFLKKELDKELYIQKYTCIWTRVLDLYKKAKNFF